LSTDSPSPAVSARGQAEIPERVQMLYHEHGWAYCQGVIFSIPEHELETKIG